MLKICMNNENKSHSRTKRSGFTLIELLVVISIIATLMSLILPAIQNAREAARRTQCLNNIRNVTVACMSFASSSPNGHLPALGYYPAAAGGTLFPTFYEGRSWVVDILPFMDQQGTYDRWDKSLPWDSTAVNSNGEMNLDLASDLYIEALACPNDESAFAIPGGLTYVANSGFGDGVVGATAPGTLGHSFFNADFDWNSNGTPKEQEDYEITFRTGVFWPVFLNGPNEQICKNRCTAVGKIYDGSANTLMLSENINAGDTNWANPSVNSCGFLFPLTGGNAALNDTDKVSNRVLENTPLAVLAGTEPYINEKKSGPEGAPFLASNHPGIVVVSFCDGSVKMLSEDIDNYVYTKLFTPDGSRLRTLGGIPAPGTFASEEPLSADSF